MNPGESPHRAALLAALDEAERALRRLPLEDTRRGELARRIVAIEDAINADMGEAA